MVNLGRRQHLGSVVRARVSQLPVGETRASTQVIGQPLISVLVGGAVVLSLLLSGTGSSQDVAPPPGCPKLPKHGVANKISLYVGKAVDTPGSVCVRAVNGLKGSGTEIRYGATAFWLEKWNDKEGKFLSLEEPDFRGAAVPLIAIILLGGERADWRLPYSHQPAPAGRYRVRFRFRVPGQGVHQELYSEEFTLP